ncbi:alpha/beta hydrolase [Rossellomorea vietnamensis]|uniref:Alpha/beta hydrolase n=1 Tax=Rossellomorea vietnamensis TaxID=218284 RepID=A0ACD4C8E7_9BACI|nr:alpha/beta hydrolase [Rossellomorea vietnamensis]UXH44916.1 alpha/beta hydrolase [Rossellomorea vietnamensis]WQI96274.1 alpha/beta hydrolase [Rossellomorea vietnamensis]
MSIKSKRSFFWSGLFIIAFFTLYTIFRTTNVQSSEKPLTAEEKYPTVFVHGYKGTYNSFRTMLDRFENRHGWGQKTLEISISDSGSIRYKGALPKNPSSPPLVQVIFEDNRASLDKQAIWLENAMKLLHHQFNVSTVNIVAHSMGGLASTQYLENTGNESFVPKTHKFITIATPFQGVTKESYGQINTGAAVIDLKPGSRALKKMYLNRHLIPSEIRVLSIAGSGDDVVNVQSALESRSFFEKNPFQSKIVYDPTISHSGLHETMKVDRLVGDYLWSK